MARLSDMVLDGAAKARAAARAPSEEALTRGAAVTAAAAGSTALYSLGAVTGSGGQGLLQHAGDLSHAAGAVGDVADIAQFCDVANAEALQDCGDCADLCACFCCILACFSEC